MVYDCQHSWGDGLTFPKTWEIEWNDAGLTENLMVRDFYQQQDNNQQISDVGDEPWQPYPLEGWYFDYTSDIKVSTAAQGATTSAAFDAIVPENLDNTVQTAYVNVRIENIGCSAFTSADRLHLYTTISGGGLSWPNNWVGTYPTNPVGYEITHDGTGPVPATVPDIDPGGTAIVEIEWNVEDMTPGDADWNPCLLARIEGVANDAIDDTSPASDNLTNWIRFNNNIAMRNLTVDEPDGQGQNLEVIGGRPYSGGYTYLGNTGPLQDTFDIFLQRGLQATSEPDITTEAEVILYFDEVGWDVSDALDNGGLKGLSRKDSTLFLTTSNNASITGIVIPADTVVPVFVGFEFLTRQVGDSMNYVIHLNQRRSSSKDTIDWAQHYLVKRNTRTLFSANAGTDVTILSGDTTTLSAASINENALYLWSDASGDTIASGQTLDVSPSASTTYTLDVIANADGYKDYDNVSVTVTNGLITSVVPNPASTTTDVSYETTGVTTVKLKVVEVATALEVDNFTVTAGTGTKTITVSGYNTGAHIITLEGDGSDLDSRTLMVQ